MDEDRVVEFTSDNETVVVDGVTMSLSCTLKTLRAGCSALGHLSLQSYQTPPSAVTSQLRMDRSDQTKQSMVIHQNVSSLQMLVFRCWKYFSCG